MQADLIFTRMVLHLASFWKWGFLAIGKYYWGGRQFSCNLEKQGISAVISFNAMIRMRR